MQRLNRFGVLCMCVVALSCKGGGDSDGPGGSPGTDDGGVDGGTGGVGGTGGIGGAGGVGGRGTTDCSPGAMRDCYTGPPGTETMGACTVGSETCNAEGTGWGDCIGEVVPGPEVPTPPGETPVDEDCDGMVDEAP